MKILGKIVVGLLLLILVLFLIKNEIFRFGVQQAVTSTTGLGLDIRKADLGVIHTHIGFEDFVLHNPEGYPDANFLIFPEIFVDYDLKSVLEGKKIHLEEVRLDLSEVTIVKNKDGALNFQKIKMPPEDKSKPQPQVVIDLLLLKIGKVTYKDYTSNPPKVQEYTVNINENLKNVSGAQDVVPLITSHVFLALQRTLLSSSVGELKSLGGALRGEAGALWNQVIHSSGDVRGTLKETKDKLKKLFQ